MTKTILGRVAAGAVCGTALLAILTNAAIGGEASSKTPPEWAYGTAPPSSSAPVSMKAVPDPAPQHLPGSTLAFTQKQANEPFGPADWFPGDHPAMPEIVSHGRKPQVWACALCHFHNGKGKPENAAVSGLPVSYFIHQMEDFRDGLRHSADPRKKNTNLMIAYAKAMSNEEIKAAAEYFGAMPWDAGKKPWVRVVESATVPKTRLASGLYMPLEGNAREPIGRRLIEVPEHPEQTEGLRDSRSGFIAYVPFGTLKKGKALVETGAGKTEACAVCHGAGLRGMGPVPGIAGRSASYVARQLYDMQQGTRKGEWGELMKPVVSRLSEDDMLAIAAYTGSLKP